MRVTEHKRILLLVWGGVFLAGLFTGFIAFGLKRFLAATEKMNVQVQKIVAASDLYTHLIAQSYSIRGYMLYADPRYLAEFRSWCRSNEKEIRELLSIVRPSRKPLVARVLRNYLRYVEICEQEIIPKVQKGRPVEAARAAWESGAVSLLREMLCSAPLPGRSGGRLSGATAEASSVSLRSSAGASCS